MACFFSGGNSTRRSVWRNTEKGTVSTADVGLHFLWRAVAARKTQYKTVSCGTDSFQSMMVDGIRQFFLIIFIIQQFRFQFLCQSQHFGVIGVNRRAAQITAQPRPHRIFQGENSPADTSGCFIHIRVQPRLFELPGCIQSVQTRSHYHDFRCRGSGKCRQTRPSNGRTRNSGLQKTPPRPVPRLDGCGLLCCVICFRHAVTSQSFRFWMAFRTSVPFPQASVRPLLPATEDSSFLVYNHTGSVR